MKHSLIALATFFVAIITLNAQTHNGGFAVQIGNDPKLWLEGECSWGGTAQWGGSITKDICAPIVWLYDKPGGQVDSLGCDTVINDYTGKWVLIRRGACEFQYKALKAQLAGAEGVIIANHYSGLGDDSCSIIIQGSPAIDVMVSIPVLFASRIMSEAIIDAIDAGNGQTELCFVSPRLEEPYTAWHYATPLSQIDTISTLAIRVHNRTDTILHNMTIKADILDPVGQLTTRIKTFDLLPDTNYLVIFDKYLPQGGMGYYNVTFSASAYLEPRDTIRTRFLITQYSFSHAVIEMSPGGMGPSNAAFAMSNLIVQNAGICITGPNGGKATFATFGISNVSVVRTPDPTANIIGIILYDADANEDGTVDLLNSFDDLNNGGIIGIGEYNISPSLINDELVSVPLYDLSGNTGVHLKPRHPYYISLHYDGTLAGTGSPIRFSSTADYNYFGLQDDAGGVASATPVYLDQLYNGYPDDEIIERLELEGFTPNLNGLIDTRPTPLSASKFNITPNPATDFLKIDLNLDAVNAGVSVSLMDYNGRTVQTQTAKNFQNGQFRFDTAQWPSGNYLLWISTGEGSAARPVAICH